MKKKEQMVEQPTEKIKENEIATADTEADSEQTALSEKPQIQDRYADRFPSAEIIEQEMRRRKYRTDYRKVLWSTVSSLIVVAAVAVLISTLVLPILRVTGTSMTPTLQNDELVVCHRTGNFAKGDIIAFYYNNKILLKRVIGTAGDIIDFDEEGTLYINGCAQDEPYVSELALGECDISLPYQVPEDRIFVLGDHRLTSIDSRSTTVGCVAEEEIIGRVVFRIWPTDVFGTIGENT